MSLFGPFFYNHNTTDTSNTRLVADSIVCAATVVVSVLVILICYCLRKHKQQSSQSTTSRLQQDPTPRTLTATSRPHQEQHHLALTVNPGINEATIEGFPRLLYSDLKRLHETRPSGSTSALTCSICLKDYNTVDDLRLLPNCGHLFHRRCIDPWLLSRVTCPLCRASPLPKPASTP